MDLSERNLLIDYLTGRLGSEESAALEERMRVDSELADAFAELSDAMRSETSYDWGIFASSRRWTQRLISLWGREKKEKSIPNGKTDDVADARFVDVSSEDLPPLRRSSASDGVVGDSGSSTRNSSSLQSNERRARRFDFIPKIVEAPRTRGDSGLIFKRASELLSDEAAFRQAKRQESARRFIHKSRSIFSLDHEDVQLAFAISNVEFSKTIRSKIPQFGVSFSSAGRDESKSAFFCSSSGARFESSAIRVSKVFAYTTGRLRSIDVSKENSTAFLLKTRSAEEKELCLAQCGNKFVPFQISTDIPASYECVGVLYGSDFLQFTPFKSRFGKSVYWQHVPPIEVPKDAENGTLDVIRTPDLERSLPTTDSVEFAPSGEEVIAPKFGTVMSRSTGTSYSVELDEEDRVNEPTLSAEERYLAELLGRVPSTVELDEFYWEEIVEQEKPERGVFANALYKAAMIVSEPPVLIGRFTISAFRACMPRGFSRGEDYKQTNRRRESDKSNLSDMVISTIAGASIAVCFVFPALRYVVDELYVTVAESRVRKLGENVVLTQHETEEALIPVTEGLHHVFYPKFVPDQSDREEDIMMNW